MAGNPYLNANGVLHNKLGIEDRTELKEYENRFAATRLAELQAKPIEGQFDLQHLKEIHKHVFQDVYEWAGQERTLNFSKRSPDMLKGLFARTEYIPTVAEKVSEATQDFVKNPPASKADAVERLTRIHAAVNFMHPFPEGNGRATQVFMGQLAETAGYRLDFSKVTKEEWNAANVRAIPHARLYEHGTVEIRQKADLSRLAATFEKVMVPEKEAANVQAFAMDSSQRKASEFTPAERQYIAQRVREKLREGEGSAQAAQESPSTEPAKTADLDR